LKRKAHEIVQIMPGSIGEELDLVPGDKLLSINDQIVWDIIDYEALCSEENINILIEKQDGTLWDVEIEKAPEEGLGLVFKHDLMDVERNCANHCIFCFIDQLPQGRRLSLYYKDDDWRLSFIMGNYITLTNLSDEEIQRIIDRRVSPLYISVHTTNPSLRVKMVGNKRAGNILEVLTRFADAGLTCHCQIVLCRGINDGEELDDWRRWKMGDLRFRQIHLDFHTSEKIVGIGDAFDPKEFAETLKKAGVNSITCFARCHHGMIYYDTKFPARHPGLKRNLLKEQIEACHQVDIRVPIYITVGWDEYIAARHPEWLERTPEGAPYGAGPLQAGWKKLCFNTPYIDYVVEQTIEVLETFGDDVDGLFFDIISQNPCCCTYCMEGMEKAGLDSETEEGRKTYALQVLNRFKKMMTDTVRKYNKTCTIFYNAGHVNPQIRDTLDTYTHLELESLPSGGWGYEHFPITVRYARNLGKECLGMTGKFHKSWADFGGFKNQPALEYECFMSLANGTKCSIGDQLHPTGAINKATYELIGRVYNQVKEKEAWCDDVEAVKEIHITLPCQVIGVAAGADQGLFLRHMHSMATYGTLEQVLIFMKNHPGPFDFLHLFLLLPLAFEALAKEFR
jgi:hypothetical protein